MGHKKARRDRRSPFSHCQQCSPVTLVCMHYSAVEFSVQDILAIGSHPAPAHIHVSGVLDYVDVADEFEIEFEHPEQLEDTALWAKWQRYQETMRLFDQLRIKQRRTTCGCHGTRGMVLKLSTSVVHGSAVSPLVAVEQTGTQSGDIEQHTAHLCCEGVGARWRCAECYEIG